MGRWKFFTPDRTAANTDEGCPVCDHPFGHLTHACISSIGPTISAAPIVLNVPIRLPEAVVA